MQEVFPSFNAQGDHLLLEGLVKLTCKNYLVKGQFFDNFNSFRGNWSIQAFFFSQFW